ncbi:unnamed protein product [Debaryomyces tyrocola]|nr:unnamed protein product [Debaryomyces tyrocola]
MLFSDLLATAVAAFYISSTQAETKNQWATFPSVARTASINGFADNIYDSLPECARSCVEADTGSTPCPYWDTGCLCVMSNWSGPVAECIAEKCKGDNVDSATSLALSICSSAGVPSPYWFIPASISTELQEEDTAEVLLPQQHLNILLMPILLVTILILSHKPQRLLLIKLIALLQHRLLLQKKLLLHLLLFPMFQKFKIELALPPSSSPVTSWS